MGRRRNLGWIALAIGLFGAAGCERAKGELSVVQDLDLVQPEVATEATEAMRAAPSRSSALAEGACATQDDCAAGELCVAMTPSVAECVAASDAPELQAPARGPQGQPAPPIGLLDGQAMRDHAARSGR